MAVFFTSINRVKLITFIISSQEKYDVVILGSSTKQSFCYTIIEEKGLKALTE
jgi:hypothetical protein